MRRSTLKAFLLACAALAAPLAGAQAFPQKPIRWVVPFARGGASDSLARALAEKLGSSLGERILVDNKPGANGNIGSAQVAKSPADGYTLLQFTDSNTISPAIYPNLAYDAVRDFAAVGMIAKGPHVIVVHPSLPVHNLAELQAFAKKQATLNYATAGVGSAQHLAGEMLKREAGLKMTHIAYKGGGAAIADLVGGQVQIGILGMAPALPQISAGKLRAIAVTGRSRTSALPDVPTVAESGVKGFESVQWFGLVAPAGTPAAVVARLNQELNAALKSKEIAARLLAIGAEAAPTSPDEFSRYIAADIDRWKSIALQMNIKAD
jgi:tripartite-type tricarboxylate transporter receptor subunit TctC